MMKRENIIPILLSACSGLIPGISILIFNPGDKPLIGFLSPFFLTFLFTFILFQTWKRLGGNRQAGWATGVSFMLRFLIGLLLFITLPTFGYDEAPPNAGYLYQDAYNRDLDAWNLANSDTSLANAFKNEFHTDQYGGLLSLSAALYRIFSLDSHRPLLILILTSFFSALGLPFFWNAVQQRWGGKVANLSAWIFALYPESIILGASQMREPILIGLSAILFWGVIQLESNRKNAAYTLGLGIPVLFFISYKAAFTIILGVVLYYWIDSFLPKSRKSLQIASYIFLIFFIACGILLSWNWLVDSSKWDVYLMESSSGRIQWELELVGERFKVPFIISYGVLQPVLPATIVYPSIPIMQAISIFRSVGWYALLLFLVMAFLLVWKSKTKKDKLTLLLIIMLAFTWTLISSVRAGGDQWDNPRYRVIFQIWFSFLGAWAYIETGIQKSRWLRRILMIEIIFCGFFIQWYLSRYYGLFKRMDFWQMILLIATIGGVIILGGIIFDWMHQKLRKSSSQGH